MRPHGADARAAHGARQRVHDFWNDASCGEALLGGGRDADAYARHRDERYRLEPFIPAFADFERYRGAGVLEIGVGLGADHERFAAARADLYGIDLTARAIDHTRARLELRGLSSRLQIADAEALPFPDGHFDLVYCWGVLHHSPSPCAKFESTHIVTRLTHADLLTSGAGQRHPGLLLDVARRVWPRRLIQRWLLRHGMFMLITATKPIG